MAFTRIEAADLAGKGNTGRADTPGVSTTEMQRILDELPREVLVPKFNALAQSLETQTAASSLGAVAADGSAGTVQGELEKRPLKVETYTRTETDAAIAAKVVQVGAGDMAQAVYDTDSDGKVNSADTADSCLGNAATATKLAMARQLGNAAFDGTADLTLAAMGALPASGGVYSTAEVDTGKKWIDGKPIYRKTLQKTMTIAAGTYYMVESTAAICADLDQYVSLSGFWGAFITTGAYNGISAFPLMFSGFLIHLQAVLGVDPDDRGVELFLTQITTGSTINTTRNVTIQVEYTKTTD